MGDLVGASTLQTHIIHFMQVKAPSLNDLAHHKAGLLMFNSLCAISLMKVCALLLKSTKELTLII